MLIGTVKGLKIFVISFSLIIPSFVFASGDDLLDKFGITENKVSERHKTEIEALYQVYNIKNIQKNTCPLQPKPYANIYKRLDSIRTLLMSSACAQENKETIDLILSGAKDVQDHIEKIKEDETSTSKTENEEYYEQIETVFNGLGSLFGSEDCASSLENKNLLTYLADIVRGVTQVGMLVPSSDGLSVIAVGGSITSVLDLIVQIFTPRFKFNDPEDRAVFRKINCAFFDIRQEMNLLGLGQSANDTNDSDYNRMNQIVGNLNTQKKSLLEIKEDILKQIKVAEDKFVVNNDKVKADRMAYVVETMSGLNNVEKSVLGLKDEVKLAKNVGEALFILRVIDTLELTKFLDTAESNYQEHKLLPLAYGFQDLRQGVFEEGQREEIRKELLTDPDKGIKELNNQVIYPMLAELDYILRTIMKTKNVYASAWDEDDDQFERRWIKEAILENGVKVSEVNSEVLPALEVIYDELKSEFEKLMSASPKLNNLIGNANTDFTSKDKGVGELRDIQQRNKQIASLVFGKYGKQFLQDTKEKSLNLYEAFNTNFKKITKAGIVVKTYPQTSDEAIECVFNSDECSIDDEVGSSFLAKFITDKIKYESAAFDSLSLETKNISCLDLETASALLGDAETVAQEGFDFIATNFDLFHTFNSRSLAKDIAAYTIGLAFENFEYNDFDKILTEYQSTIYANRYYDLYTGGDEIPEEIAELFDKHVLDGSKGNLGRLIHFSYNLKDELKMLQNTHKSCLKLYEMNFQ